MSIERRYSLLKHDHSDVYLPLTGGTLTGDLVVTNADPRITLLETGATADEGRWELLANTDELFLRAVTDADGGQKNILNVSRSGSAISTVDYGNATDNPVHSMYGNLRLGAGNAPSSSVSSLAQYVSFNGDTNNDHIGLELYVADGTNNQRMWLFNDDSTQYLGIDFTYSSGLNGFQIRRAGTKIFEINGLGQQVDITPSGTSKLTVNTTGLGFFATTPIAKPTVTGSRGGNAALASLLTALANYGLITNSTT